VKDSVLLDGKIYISSRRAAEVSHYTTDYIGQLCRAGKIDCRIVGRTWFVMEESVLEHQKLAANSLTNGFNQAYQQEVPLSPSVSTLSPSVFSLHDQENKSQDEPSRIGDTTEQSHFFKTAAVAVFALVLVGAVVSMQFVQPIVSSVTLSVGDAIKNVSIPTSYASVSTAFADMWDGLIGNIGSGIAGVLNLGTVTGGETSPILAVNGSPTNGSPTNGITPVGAGTAASTTVVFDRTIASAPIVTNKVTNNTSTFYVTDPSVAITLSSLQNQINAEKNFLSTQVDSLAENFGRSSSVVVSSGSGGSSGSNSGNGSALDNLNASNISSGVLAVSYGGTGLTSTASSAFMLSDSSSNPYWGTTTPAFTLGGAITGNNENLTGLNQLSVTQIAATGANVSSLVASTSLTLPYLAGFGSTQCLQVGTNGVVSATGAACGNGGGGAVNVVSNSDGTLTVSPTTGVVVASLNLAHANTWTGAQTFNATTTLATTTATTLAVNSLSVGSLNGLLFGTNGAVSAIATSSVCPSCITGNQTITLSGDISGSGTTSINAILATVNSNTGSFGGSTAIPNFTVNAKGLIIAVGTSSVIAPAGTLTGTTLASNILSSSLTGVGILTSGSIASGFGSINIGGNTFTGSGSGLTNLSANALSGIVAPANGGTGFSSGSTSSFFLTDSSGNPYTGTTTPAFTLGGTVTGSNQKITGLGLISSTGGTFTNATATNATTTNLAVTGTGTTTFNGGIIATCFATTTGGPCITGGGSSGSDSGDDISLSGANTWTGQQTFSTLAPIFSTETAGSIFFAGSGGLLSQNNSDFFWDNTNNALDIGTTSNITSNVNAGVLNVLGTTTNTTNLALFRANVNNYAQVSVVNANAGATSSADFIVGNNLNDTNPTSYYGDFGINSSGNTDANYTGLQPNDTFLYSSDGGLDLGTATSSTSSTISFFTGGLLSADQRLTITSQGFIGIGSTSPSNALEVNGNGYFSGNFSIGTTTGTTTIASNLQVNYGSLAYDVPSGITNIDSLQTGALNFDTDAGAISWADLPLDSTPIQGTIESYSAQVGDTPILTVYGESNGSGGVQNTRIGIGTTSPVSVLAVVGTTTFAGNVIPGSSYGYTLGTSASHWLAIYASTTYSGDTIFGNNFDLLENKNPDGTFATGTTAGMIWENGTGTPIFSLDASGNLAVNGDVCAFGSFGSSTQCLGSAWNNLDALTSQVSALSSTTVTLGNVNTSASTSLADMATQIASLNTQVAALTSFVSSTTAWMSATSTFAASAASTTATALASSTPFVQIIANAVIAILQSSGQVIQSAATWTVNEIHATLAVFSDVRTSSIETQTASVTNGIEMTSPNGQVWCVRAGDTGILQQTSGSCTTAVLMSVTATSTSSETSSTTIENSNNNQEPITSTISSTATSTTTTTVTPTTATTTLIVSSTTDSLPATSPSATTTDSTTDATTTPALVPIPTPTSSAPSDSSVLTSTSTSTSDSASASTDSSDTTTTP